MTSTTLSFPLSDYHYVTKDAMQTAVDNGEFIESAVFSGNMYGTSKAAVQAVRAKNLICILDIDMQGVRNIKKTDLNAIYVSIQAPSMDTLVRAGRLSVKAPAPRPLDDLLNDCSSAECLLFA